MKPILERQTVGEILELSIDPTIEEVKVNYKRLIKKYHPDINKSPEAVEYARRIIQAYKIATDHYDQLKNQQRPSGQTVIITVYGGGSSVTYTRSSDNGGWWW